MGRNFDEVISCFANSPSDSRLLNEAQATAYDEEDAKVGTKLLLILPGGAGTAVMLLARVDCRVLLPEHP